MANNTEYHMPEAADCSREIITQQNQRNSLFLRLPAELRTRVYERACVGAVITVTNAANIRSLKPGVTYTNRHQAASALLHLCRQVRHEVLPIFYLHAIFKFRKRGTEDLRKRLDPDVCDNMRSIQLNEDIADAMSANWRHWEDWKVSRPTLFKDSSPNIFAANLPRLDYVYVQIDPKVRMPLSDYIYGNMEEAARECYSKDNLIAVVTTLPNAELVE